MIKALCKKSRDNKGFSLIELIGSHRYSGHLALILVQGSQDLRRCQKAADDAIQDNRD